MTFRLNLLKVFEKSLKYGEISGKIIVINAKERDHTVRHEILSVGFDSVTMDEALEKAYELAKNGKGCYIVTPNSEIVYECRKNEKLRQVVRSADMVVPDGIGVVYAAKILGRSVKQKVAGVELGEKLIAKMAETGGKVYLLGAKPGIADEAAKKLCEKYKGLNIVGTHDGYFKDDSEVIADINDKAPNVLLVCLGVPKQELWMSNNSDKLNVNVMLGLGGSLDIYAGAAKRAPDIFIKLGLEWLYRLIKEPWRFKRMLRLPLFLMIAVKARIFGDEFEK